MTAASAAVDCLVPPIRTVDNGTATGTMYATSGRPCDIMIVRTLGPMYTAQIVQRAKNGKVSIDQNKIVYTSRPGYVGEDQFTYVRHGLNEWNTPVVRTISVTVQVTAP